MALSSTGVLTTGGQFQLTGKNLDIEAFKNQFQDIIAGYNDMIGGWSIDLNLAENSDNTCTVKAVITFENMIDACYFAQIWPDETGLPDFCAIYLPTAASGNLVF